MHHSIFKPEEVIRSALQDYSRVAVVSCGLCANWSGTGGLTGLRIMRGWLEDWGKEVVAARVVTAACCESIMRSFVRHAILPHRQDVDILIVLSCAAGVKAAFLCRPGVRIYGALDSIGAAPMTRSTALIAHGTCRFCSHCVLSHTHGICPLARCPAQRAYGPCAKAPLREQPDRCVIDPDRACVWREIIALGGDLKALSRIKSFHQHDTPRMTMPETRLFPARALIREPLAFFMERCGALVARVAQWLW